MFSEWMGAVFFERWTDYVTGEWWMRVWVGGVLVSSFHRVSVGQPWDCIGCQSVRGRRLLTDSGGTVDVAEPTLWVEAVAS